MATPATIPSTVRFGNYPWKDDGVNPAQLLISLKGKDYLPVAARMRWFIDEQRAMIANDVATRPFTIEILTREIDFERRTALFVVRLTDVLGNVVENIGSESGQDFGDYIEKAHTKALGRCLAQLGYSTGSAADFDESEDTEVRRPVDAPIERRPAAKATVTPQPAPPTHALPAPKNSTPATAPAPKPPTAPAPSETAEKPPETMGQIRARLFKKLNVKTMETQDKWLWDYFETTELSREQMIVADKMINEQQQALHPSRGGR